MKCAFYESDITPFLGCSMPGYFNVRFGTDVKDRLYAKAAVISDGANVAAILAIDSVGITTETCAAITGRIGKYTDLKTESVMMCGTHTHTGGPRI